MGCGPEFRPVPEPDHDRVPGGCAEGARHPGRTEERDRGRARSDTAVRPGTRAGLRDGPADRRSAGPAGHGLGYRPGPVMAASAAGYARIRRDLGRLGRPGPTDRVRPDRTPAGDLGRPVAQLGDHAADRRRDLRRVRDAGVAFGLDRVRPGTRVRQVVHVQLAGPRYGGPGRLPPDDRRRRNTRAVADHRHSSRACPSWCSVAAPHSLTCSTPPVTRRCKPDDHYR